MYDSGDDNDDEIKIIITIMMIKKLTASITRTLIDTNIHTNSHTYKHTVNTHRLSTYLEVSLEAIPSSSSWVHPVQARGAWRERVPR